jgi:hypothetical protein
MADDYEYENEGTKAFVNKLRYQGMKDSDIEASGIYKFKKKKGSKSMDNSNPVEKAYNQGKTSIKAEQAVGLREKTGNPYQRAKKIMSKALTKTREAVMGSHAYEGETQQQRQARVKEME